MRLGISLPKCLATICAITALYVIATEIAKRRFYQPHPVSALAR